jgi:hypothetical protein
MCALKVSLATAKGMRMPARDRLHAILRLLRLTAALSLIAAVAAVIKIANGDSAASSQALLTASIVLGSVALLGMALLALSYVRRKKEQNDPRP